MEKRVVNVSHLLDEASKKGWIIHTQNEDGIQLIRKKIYNTGIYYAGLITLILGIGIFILAYGFAEYLTRRDEVLFIKNSDLYKNDFTEKYFESIV